VEESEEETESKDFLSQVPVFFQNPLVFFKKACVFFCQVPPAHLLFYATFGAGSGASIGARYGAR